MKPPADTVDLAVYRIDGPSLEDGSDCTLLHVLRAGGLGQPVAVARRAALDALCRTAGLDNPAPSTGAATGAELALAMTEGLLAAAHGRRPMAVRVARSVPGAVVVSPAAETVARRAAHVAVATVADILAAGEDWPTERLAAEIARLRQLVAGLPENADPVTPIIVEAAGALGLACRPSRLQPGTLVIGEGCNQVRFDRSAPLNAPTLGAVLSPSKLATKRFLAGLGIPVLPCRIPADAEEAARGAAEIGFPVAIKPIDGTFSQGVTLDVRTPEEASAAFDHAMRHGTAVMIEPYLDMPDFRATVVGGEIAIVMQRNRPFVVGDGERSVAQLIAVHNAELASGSPRFPATTPVEIDDEVRWTLGRAGLSADSVPAAGAHVFVRTATVRSLGGYPTDETARTHPDTLRLFERLARVLAMPVVAVDFRAEDPQRPWQEQRIAVLEANARPGIGDIQGDRIARRILAHHFPDPAAARLPTVLVVDPDAEQAFPAAAALADIRGLGLAGPSGLLLDGFPAGDTPPSVGAAHARIAEDPTIRLALHWTTPRRVGRRGLGLARIDHAFLPADSSGPVAALVRRHAERIDTLDGATPLGDRIAAVRAAAMGLLGR